MSTHPVFLCLQGCRCVVVGGDGGAAGRARALRDAGARVTVVAPRTSPEMDAVINCGGIEHLAREVRRGDLAGALLAYATECDAAASALLTAEARAERVLLNVADQPTSCTFHAPAVVDRGALKIAIGTAGASPGLAGALRRELEDRFGPEYSPFVRILGAVRRWQGTATGVEALRTSSLLELVRRGSHDEIDRLLTALVGEGCTLAALGVDLEEAA